MAILTKKEWLRRKQKIRKIKIVLISVFMMFLGTVSIIAFTIIKDNWNSISNNIEKVKGQLIPVEQSDSALKSIETIKYESMLLTPNDYSRPQTPLTKVNGVVVHYTGNPGTRGESNRNYFENLRIKKTTSASSHYVIGLEGEIIQCIPLDEVAYASNDRNLDTISIECCHPDETGKFNDETYDSLIRLVAWICYEYDLERGDIIRHYDVTGKECPRYFVDHEDEWELFKDQVMSYIDENIKAKSNG